MKPFKGSFKQTVKEYWRSMMHSAKNNKISRGAASIAKSVSSTLSWARKNDKKKKHE